MSETRRRPSGERPPLPKEFSRSDIVWIAICVASVAGLAIAGFLNRESGWLDRLDLRLADEIVSARSPALIKVARGVARLVTPGPMQFLSAAVVIGLVVLRRTRRLVLFLLALLGVYATQALLAGFAQRPRPAGLEILGDWAGYSFPSDSVTAFTAISFAACFCFLAKGKPRQIGATAVLICGGCVAIAQVILGVDHLSDAIAGSMLATAIVLAIFRSLAPDSLFPITHGGNTAHLDLGGARGKAIRRALTDQLGLECQTVEPFGLEGSAGSTPMVITAIEDESSVTRKYFAKLYSTSHVRADWLYKTFRTLRYGRLEDETGFRSVRRIVEYEDYILRLMADAGLPVVTTYGIVEITPEREYLLITDFAVGAREIADPLVDVDDEIIDQGLGAVRRMWDAGLSHRDIKPSNLIVRDAKLIVIDVAFGSVRSTPWRQAVDLACMMLVLSLRADPDRVYEAALSRFTRDEVAEAFAAARGAVIPGQLRTMLREDGRDLVSRFRELAGRRRPVRIQRWSLRRVGLFVASALVLGLTTILVIETVIGPDRGAVGPPECPDSSAVILTAQATPEAKKIVCIKGVVSGWSHSETVVTEMGLESTYDNDRSGSEAMTLTFTESCDTSKLSPAGKGIFRSSNQIAHSVEGGCAVLTFKPEGEAWVVNEGQSMIDWVERSELGAAAQSGLK